MKHTETTEKLKTVHFKWKLLKDSHEQVTVSVLSNINALSSLN